MPLMNFVSLKRSATPSTIVEQGLSDLGALYEQLAAGTLTEAEWFAQMTELLSKLHLRAYLSGRGIDQDTRLSTQEKRALKARLAQQLDFFSGFMKDVKSGRYKDSPAGGINRAKLYGGALRGTWWAGNTYKWALPAMPGDGTTQCMTRCRCSWRVVEAKDGQSADCYWELGPAEQHCQTCLARHRRWYPLHVERLK